MTSQTDSKPGKAGTRTASRTWGDLYRERGVVQAEPSPEAAWAIDQFHRAGLRSVLDLGCGTGRHTRLLVAAGFSVAACDRARDALKLASATLPGVGFRYAEMTALPYTDAAFEGVLCYQVIQHGRWADICQAVSEMKRALAAGGLLFLRVPSIEHPESNTGREVEPGTRIGIDAIDGDVPHHYFAEPELRQLFADFGITHLAHKHHASGKDPSRPAASWSLLAGKPTAPPPCEETGS